MARPADDQFQISHHFQKSQQIVNDVTVFGFTMRITFTSTNMSGIGLVMSEIAFEIWNFRKKKKQDFF